MIGRPVRVLLVIDRLNDRAGAEGSTALLVRALQGADFEFMVLTVGGGVDLVDLTDLEERGVRFRSCSGLPRCAWEVRKVIRDWRPDIVHAVLFRSELAARVGAFDRAPVLASIVNTQYGAAARDVARSPRKLEVVRRLDGFLARHATRRFHAVSEAAASEAVRSLRVPAERITVVHRGRDPQVLGRRTEERRRGSRDRLGLTEDTPVVLTTSRHEPQKRLDLLLEAFSRVLPHQPDAVLLVAGREGSTTPMLQKRIEDLALDQNVRLLGQRDDVADLLSAADVFGFSSMYEGLPGAIIEALALELPVVAFDVPTVREAVGEAGVLVPPGDTRQMAAAIDALLDDAGRCLQLAALGRRRFEELFTLNRYVAEFADLYRSIANGSA